MTTDRSLVEPTHRSQPDPAVAVAVIAGGTVCWLGALAMYLGGDPVTVMGVVLILLMIVVLPVVIAVTAR